MGEVQNVSLRLRLRAAWNVLRGRLTDSTPHSEHHALAVATVSHFDERDGILAPDHQINDEPNEVALARGYLSLVEQLETCRDALADIAGYGISPNNGYPVVSADVVKKAKAALASSPASEPKEGTDAA